MNSEQRWQIFQIKPGKALPLAIDPDDPKGIKAIQAIIKADDEKKAKEAKGCV